MTNKKIILTEEQKKHFDNCVYVETCDFCKWIIKQKKDILKEMKGGLK